MLSSVVHLRTTDMPTSLIRNLDFLPQLFQLLNVFEDAIIVVLLGFSLSVPKELLGSFVDITVDVI